MCIFYYSGWYYIQITICDGVRIMFIVVYVIVQNFEVRKFSFWKRKTFFIKQGCIKLIKSDLFYRTKLISDKWVLIRIDKWTVNEK